MTTHHVGQTVSGTVVQILPFGVFVQLDDGERAYIRRRELSLDADVDPLQVVHEGERACFVMTVVMPDLDIGMTKPRCVTR